MAFLNGQAIPEPDTHGERILDSDFLLLFNAHSASVDFTLPPAVYGTTWRIRLDTTVAEPSSDSERDWLAATSHAVAGRSVVVLESVPETSTIPEPAVESAAPSLVVRTKDPYRPQIRR